MPLESDPAGIIRYALEESRGRGLDSLGQMNYAVRRVLAVRPDVGRSRAESLVQDAMWPRQGHAVRGGPAHAVRGGPAGVPPPRRRPPAVLRPESGSRS